MFPTLNLARYGIPALLWLYVTSRGAFSQATGDSHSNPCGQKPTCSLSAAVDRYIWHKIEAPSTFTAFTIVTVINTVLDTTTTSTIMGELPESDYDPPPTNSEGKRVHTLPYYDSNGDVKTTVLTFPTIFVDWGTDYKVYGDWAVTNTENNETTCVRLGSSASTVVPITGDPQPTPPQNLDPELEPGDDIFGWGYTMAGDGSDNVGLFKYLIDLLPEEPDVPHSALTKCWGENINDFRNHFDASWMAVGAQHTLYVGGGKDDEGMTSREPFVATSVPTDEAASSVVPTMPSVMISRSSSASSLHLIDLLHSKLAVWALVCYSYVLGLAS